MTRHREISIIIHHLTASGVIDERQEALARQAVYEGLKQIQKERREEFDEQRKREDQHARSGGDPGSKCQLSPASDAVGEPANRQGN